MSAPRYEVGCRDNPSHHWITDEPGEPAIGRCRECGALGLTIYGRLIVEADELTDADIEHAIDCADFYPPPEKIDWDDLLDRMESIGLDGISFGDDSDSPAIRKIKREVRAARRDAL